LIDSEIYEETLSAAKRTEWSETVQIKRDVSEFRELVFRSRRTDAVLSFLSYFVEKNVKELESLHDENKACGDSEFEAYVKALQQSCFSSNVLLYFRFTENNFSDEFKYIIDSAIAMLEDVNKSAYRRVKKYEKKIDDIIKEKELAISKCQSEILAMAQERNSEIPKYNNELEAALKEKDSEIEKCKSESDSLKQKCMQFESRINGYEQEAEELKQKCLVQEKKIKELSDGNKNSARNGTINVIRISRNPKRPREMERFKLRLHENLKQFGLFENKYESKLLVSHLSEILFQGKPILINMLNSSDNIIKCISNAIIGNAKMNTIKYTDSLTQDELDEFLSKSDRIVCLINFVGNCNETLLIPLINMHRDKIIFMTVAYDRTIFYISNQFLEYCNYLNINRLHALQGEVENYSQIARIAETDNEYLSESDSKMSNNFRAILKEMGLTQTMSRLKSANVINNDDCLRKFVFDVLPYFFDVLQINPFHESPSLQKFANSRNSLREYFRDWFEYE
jgi:hypothetical protein